MSDPNQTKIRVLGLGSITLWVLFSLMGCSHASSYSYLWGHSEKEAERVKALPPLNVPEEYQNLWPREHTYDIPPVDRSVLSALSDEPPVLAVGRDHTDEQ